MRFTSLELNKSKYKFTNYIYTPFNSLIIEYPTPANINYF